MITRLKEGMKKLTAKPADYENGREVQQEQGENPAVFQGRLVEAFRKNTNADPSSPEGQALLAVRFTAQSAPDVRRISCRHAAQMSSINHLICSETIQPHVSHISGSSPEQQ